MKQQDINILLDKLAAGKITAEELHILEQIAVEDDMVFDALEGYRLQLHQATDVDTLKAKLEAQTEPEKKKVFPIWKYAVAAATFGVLLFAGWWMINQSNDIKMASKSEPSEYNLNKETTPDVSNGANETELLADVIEEERFDKKSTPAPAPEPKTKRPSPVKKESPSPIIENQAPKTKDEPIVVEEEIVEQNQDRAEVVFEDDSSIELENEKIVVLGAKPETTKMEIEQKSSAPPAEAANSADAVVKSAKAKNKERGTIDGVKDSDVDNTILDEVNVVIQVKVDTIVYSPETTNANQGYTSKWNQFALDHNITSDQHVRIYVEANGEYSSIECIQCQESSQKRLIKWIKNNKDLFNLPPKSFQYLIFKRP